MATHRSQEARLIQHFEGSARTDSHIVETMRVIDCFPLRLSRLRQTDLLSTYFHIDQKEWTTYSQMSTMESWHKIGRAVQVPERLVMVSYLVSSGPGKSGPSESD